MSSAELIPHLFRTESRKITSVLCKYFGADKLDLAEDIVGEVFLLALETWPYEGVPPNPVGWLYAVAKNKTKNTLSREKLFSEKVAKLITADDPHELPEIDLSELNIRDSQMKMMFVICHPSIPVESQIALSLRILCGFGIDEIATAFLTNKETINKRLHRAKETLRKLEVQVELPPDELIEQRIETVMTTLYLLFSEGYYSETQDSILREELCIEAMRLVNQLMESERLVRPTLYALYSLMCFQASRFPARRTLGGDAPILYDDQDDSLWDKELISRGAFYLNKASIGSAPSRFHLEAAIAYWHTTKDTDQKWPNILNLYDQLVLMVDSPIVKLNRIYALHRCDKTELAISDAVKLNLTSSHFYYVLLGELYREINKAQSVDYFLEAMELAKTNAEKSTIKKKLADLNAQN